MITIFTIPKAFTDHTATIQFNALQSWTLLRPSCEVILCGNDPGVKEAAAQFSVRHLPEIERTEYGTPLLSSAFEKVVEIAKHPLLCYVNADIIFLDDLLRAVRRVSFPEYLIVGQRLNIDLRRRWEFDAAGWDNRLLQFAHETGEAAPPCWIDYFVFTPNGNLEKLPPFAVGRPGWDNWFIFNARRSGVPVIDVTRAVTAIHQNHDYAHVPDKSGARWNNPEGARNKALSRVSMGSARHTFNILDATYLITERRVTRAVSIQHLRQHVKSSAVLYPAVQPLIHALGSLSGMPKRLKRRLKSVV